MLYTILLLCIVLSAIPVDGLTCKHSGRRALCYTRSKKISYTGSLSNCVKVCKTKEVRVADKTCDACRKKFIIDELFDDDSNSYHCGNNTDNTTTPSVLTCLDIRMACSGCNHRSKKPTRFCKKCHEELKRCRKYERRTLPTTTTVSTTRKRFEGPWPAKECPKLWLEFDWFCRMKATTRYCKYVAVQMENKYCYNHKYFRNRPE
ncbi:unnamed protein product [Cylicocyclus nassatus]|uniref:Uncharacterized protein n=1 Tax=Cylicocyclus nassatus TaxID=53992 RepID=A0AA36GMR3_CYLNA|nr:unnamed protein product [Cylicocyclus nassatus]